jgi:hypothetical protein
MPEKPEERRLTNIKLTVPQLQWVKAEAVARRWTMGNVIEAALIEYGAPPPTTGRNAVAE